MSHEQIDNRFMEFRLGDQFYAIPLLNVKEVIQKPDVTDVPNMPAHFEGMINLRGQILGVFDVRKKLGAKNRDSANHTPEVVIVIEQDQNSVGMIVDEVTRVLHPEAEMLSPAPLKDDDVAKKYIGSVIKIDNNLVMIVNVGQLLELEKYNKSVKAA